MPCSCRAGAKELKEKWYFGQPTHIELISLFFLVRCCSSKLNSSSNKGVKIFQVIFFIHNIIVFFCYTIPTGHPIRFEWHEDDKTSWDETCSSSSGYWVDLLYVTQVDMSASTWRRKKNSAASTSAYKSLQLCLWRYVKELNWMCFFSFSPIVVVVFFCCC